MTIEYLDSKRITTTPVTTSTNGTTADATNSSSGTSQVTGKVGNALDFSSGRYTIPKEATDFGNEWSFNFWVNPQSASGNDYFLHHTSASHVGSSFYMYNSDDDPSGSGGVMVNVRDSTNTKLTLDSSDNHIVFDINSLAGTWVMCTVTWNNSDKKLRLYQNGSLRATSKAWTHSSAGNMAVSGADWTIGNYQTQTGSTYSARSKFDEWSFWSTTLSQADITELYTGIKATELSNSTAISKLKIYYNFEQGANNTITNQAPTTVEQSKPTDVQDNSILIQKDTARRYWRSGEVSGSDTNTSQSTYNDDSGIDSSTGGWGARFNAGHALVGQEIRSIKVRMRCASSNTVNMTARLYGSTKATLRATSTAVSSSGLTSSYVDKTFVFPSGSRGVVQAGDHIMIVADSAVASSGGWNCQIKSGAGTNTHFTTWQGQSNAFTEQTTRELWYDPIVSGTFTAAAWTPESASNYTTDFSSSTGWTATRSQASITSSALSFSTITDGNNTSIAYELDANASDTWTLKAKIAVPTQNHNSTGYGQGVYFGLSDSDQTKKGSETQDFVGMKYMHDNIDRPLGGVHADNEHLEVTRDSMGSYGVQFGSNITANTTMYIKITRESATQYKVQHYSNSGYTTLVAELSTVTMSVTPTGLRYIVFRNVDDNVNQSGGETLTIDDIVFTNGSTA